MVFIFFKISSLDFPLVFSYYLPNYKKFKSVSAWKVSRLHFLRILLLLERNGLRGPSYLGSGADRMLGIVRALVGLSYCDSNG